MARTSNARCKDGTLSRHVAIGAFEHTAFLIVDVQYYVAAPGFGDHKSVDPENIPEELQYYFGRLSNIVLPNIKRVQDVCRDTGIEVLFTLVENLTQDGRDRSLDYKISGFNVPKGSREAQVLDEIKPVDDEIVIPKTSSSVFNSTNIDYVLRNLEIDYLIVAGMLTDQCLESAVRDACDLGYLVSVVEDASVTYTPERHQNSLDMYSGYCRVISTGQILEEIKAGSSS